MVEGEELAQRVGGTIRAWRRASGQTQRQLAEAAGVSAMWVSELERGRATPTLDTLSRLSDALDAPLALLLASADGPPGTADLAARVRRLPPRARGVATALAARMDTAD